MFKCLQYIEELWHMVVAYHAVQSDCRDWSANSGTAIGCHVQSIDVLVAVYIATSFCSMDKKSKLFIGTAIAGVASGEHSGLFTIVVFILDASNTTSLGHCFSMIIIMKVAVNLHKYCCYYSLHYFHLMAVLCG